MLKNNNIITMSVNTVKKMERSTNSDGKMVLRSYHVIFDDEYKFIDWYTGDEWIEKIDSTAFRNVDWSRTLVLRDHDFSRVLGRNGKNSRIEVDNTGVFCETILPDTELARETYILAEAEICDQCSFGFTIKAYTRDLENRIETITEVGEVYELTITPIPAYKSTVVTTMSEKRNEFLKIEKENEKIRLESEKLENRIAEYKKRMKELSQ